MTSKYQKRSFPIDKLGKLQSIKVRTTDGSNVEIEYQDLKLFMINNQLCWFYESDDGDLIMPIARHTTIDKLFDE